MLETWSGGCYQHLRNGSRTQAGSQSSVTIHSLSNGKTYRFYAVAVNDARASLRAALISGSGWDAQVGPGARTSIFTAEMRCTPRSLVAAPYKAQSAFKPNGQPLSCCSARFPAALGPSPSPGPRQRTTAVELCRETQARGPCRSFRCEIGGPATGSTGMATWCSHSPTSSRQCRLWLALSAGTSEGVLEYGAWHRGTLGCWPRLRRHHSEHHCQGVRFGLGCLDEKSLDAERALQKLAEQAILVPDDAASSGRRPCFLEPLCCRGCTRYLRFAGGGLADEV